MVATPSGVRRRHFMDTATGMYRGKQIIAVGGPVAAAPAKAKKAAKKVAPAKAGKE